MRFFLQVVALEPRAIIGGGSDPRQFVHDAAMCWSGDVVGTHALAFSISHLLAFLVSRGQVDYVSRICRAMLGNSGDIQNVDLQDRGSRGVFDGRRVARGEKMDEDVTMKNGDRDAEVESHREAEGSSWLDGVPKLAYLRLLGECYLTTSNNLVTPSFEYRNDSNLAATSVSTTIPVFSAMHTSVTASNSATKAGGLILSEHHEAARAEHNMWLAFRYLLRSCPAAYIGGGGSGVRGRRDYPF